MAIIQGVRMNGTLARSWIFSGAPVDGVAGTLAGIAEPGDLLLRTDAGNIAIYQNTNTRASPTWSGISAVTYGVVGQMAAAGTAAANAAGAVAAVARIDHVHALGTHTHTTATTGAQIGPGAFAAGAFTADAAGRAPFAALFVNTAMLDDLGVTGAKIANTTVTNGKLAVGILSADATGRALIAANFFDAATAEDKFADSSIPADKVNWGFGGNPTTIAPDDAAAPGTGGSPSRIDHVHGITAAAPGATNSFAAAVAEGAATSFLRSDAVFLARVANNVYWLGRNAADGANINAWQISSNDLFRIGTVSWEVATANLATFTVTNPAAPRTITFGDPGGADSVVYLAATQTLTGKSLTAPAITGGTAIELTGFSIRSTGAAFDMLQATATVFTADRTLNWNIGDASRTVTLTGNLTMSGTFNLTLTITADTNVTLPTTGTLATLAGAETLTNKTINTMVGALNMTGQILYGSAVANGDLTLAATSHATVLTAYIIANQMLDATVNSLAVRVKAGAVGDGETAQTDLNGEVAIDSTNGRWYFRYGAAWHYTAITAGFQIPKEETVCPMCSTALKVGQNVVGLVESIMSDGALHGLYRHQVCP